MIKLGESDGRRVQLEGATLAPVILLGVNWIPAVYVTDAAHDLTVGGNLYRTGQGLAGLSPPEISEGVGDHNFTVAFVDADPAAAESWASRFSATPKPSLDVLLAFRTASGITATLDLYHGRYGGHVRKADTDQGAVIEVVFQGELAALDDSVSVLTTPENQRQRGVNDTSLKYVHRTYELVWGRDE